MRPVNDPAPVVPLKHPVELHLIPRLEACNPGSKINIVSDQQCSPARQPQYKALMATPAIVIRKHFRDGPATLNQDSTFATFDRICQGSIGGSKGSGCSRNRGCSAWRNRGVVADSEVACSQNCGNQDQFFHVHHIQPRPQSVCSMAEQRKHNRCKSTDISGVSPIPCETVQQPLR